MLFDFEAFAYHLSIHAFPNDYGVDTVVVWVNTMPTK
jgi:hypothetical protein